MNQTIENYLIVHDKLTLVALAAEHPDWWVGGKSKAASLRRWEHLGCTFVTGDWNDDVYEVGLQVSETQPTMILRCAQCAKAVFDGTVSEDYEDHDQ